MSAIRWLSNGRVLCSYERHAGFGVEIRFVSLSPSVLCEDSEELELCLGPAPMAVVDLMGLLL